jgi:RimJ/RimL family protein N-acetyltransferase
MARHHGRLDSSAALAAYLAQGFTVIGTARNHAKIDNRYADEVLIERALSS